LIVPSQKQIAANRRNARRSTGPRSGVGKRRSSQNAYRHGLSAGMSAHAEYAKDIEMLAGKIAKQSTDVVVLECARTIADAEIDLARIRRLKVALISHVNALGEVKPAPTFQSQEIKQFFKGANRGELILPERNELPEMPITEPERSTEAVRRALPQLMSLNRYERRAAARRAQAMHTLLERRGYPTTRGCN
jgi:hypothetical protein